MWLIQFIFGMFIAYLFLSPRLRNFIFRRNNHTPSTTDRVASEEHPTPTQKNLMRSGHEIEVKEDKVEEWMTNNPHLWEINRGEK